MTGAVTISLDFEAGWGVIGNGQWRRREASGVYRELRPALRRFVTLLDNLEISCTWAVAGAMIEPPEVRDITHLKGTYGTKARAFLDQAEAETHDGRDLLDIVRAAKTHQTFGSHGYSHVLFTDPEQDRSVYSGELARACAANKAAGIGSEFFVFPENRAAYFDVLAEAGVRIARMPPRNAPAPGQWRNPVRRAIGAALRPPSPVVEWDHPDGVLLHAGSELLNWGDYGGFVKAAITRERIERALRLASRGAHIHLWMHPFDLVSTRGLSPFVESFLTRAARARDAGRIAFQGIS